MKRLSFSLLFLIPYVAIGQVSVATSFSSNMVLQREEPIAVWGKAVPGAEVTVQFAGESKKMIAAVDSGWIVYFQKQPANKKPQSINIESGNSKIELNNILVGDVWLCIGQSNMEWPLQRELHYKTELPLSNLHQLRLYNPSYAGKNIFASAFTDSVTQLLTPEHFYKGTWHQCDSASVKQMSAVAYYFGKELATSLDVPIGLINLSIGGAPLETFIDPVVLQQSKQFASKVNGDWLQNTSLPVWIKERGQQNVGKSSTVPSDSYGKNHAYKPGFAYKAGIELLFRFAINGIINYQGESNAQEKERVTEYAALSALMIKDFRSKWKKPKLPYYYVQLSSIDTIQYKGQLWSQFRNEQRRMMQLIPNSGMAVSSDHGAKNDVHPTNKKIVGQRLAKWALNQTYQQKIIPSGPLPLQATYKNGFVIISFQYAEGLQTSNASPVSGFSLDGKEMSEAIIHNKQVLVKSKQKPGYIYYGWQPFSKGNLVNEEQLPASTFKLLVK
jgi:sialate O-acetylesterase